MREEGTLELVNMPIQVQGLGSGVSLDTVEVCPMYRFWEVCSLLKLWRCYPRYRVWEAVPLENVSIEQSSMCYRVGSCWLLILNIIVFTCPS